MFRICSLFAIVLALFISGCSDRDTSKDTTVKWTKIHRVMMNDAYQYTFLMEDDKKGAKELHTVVVANGSSESSYGHKSPRIVTDVPEGEFAWAEAKLAAKKHHHYYSLEIHIHSAKDIQGGGWEKREGKTTRKGQNNPIE